MRFADDLLELYLRHFNDNESDSLELFVHSILEQMDYKDILEVFETCPKEELNKMLGRYLSANIEGKLKDTSLPDNEESFPWKNAQ